MSVPRPHNHIAGSTNDVDLIRVGRPIRYGFARGELISIARGDSAATNIHAGSVGAEGAENDSVRIDPTRERGGTGSKSLPPADDSLGSRQGPNRKALVTGVDRGLIHTTRIGDRDWGRRQSHTAQKTQDNRCTDELLAHDE